MSSLRVLARTRSVYRTTGALNFGGAQQRPGVLCLRACYAVERIIVEAQIVKLDLCTPDVVLREIRGVYPMLRSFRLRGHVPFRTRNGVTGVCHIIESGAAISQ